MMGREGGGQHQIGAAVEDRDQTASADHHVSICDAPNHPHLILRQPGCLHRAEPGTRDIKHCLEAFSATSLTDVVTAYVSRPLQLGQPQRAACPKKALLPTSNSNDGEARRT